MTKSRIPIHISTIRIRPPTNSASVNCQPRKIQSTIPISKTRFVEANWKTIAVAKLAPFWNIELRDRDRRVAARGRGRAEAGRERDRASVRARRAPAPSASAAPRPGRSPRGGSRARAPTRPPTPSGRRTRDPRRSGRERPRQATIRRSALDGQAQAERDEHGSGARVEGAPDAWPEQDVRALATTTA